MFVSFLTYVNRSTYLSSKEANVFSFNVFPKCHLKKGESHVKGFNNVALSCQRVISVIWIELKIIINHHILSLIEKRCIKLLLILFLPSCWLPSWHLCLNSLKPGEHMALQSLKSAVEHRGTYFVEASGYLKLKQFTLNLIFYGKLNVL